ncbi:MAG: XTP/dITP diphosphatase [Deltaproteobacteria bacterium]|nr:XTP/dITP diphosphatase [Deltaproteobacteria bacterium]MCB2186322.1 XTP/dITP diphosphatase [Deltaproteobacteria bacterium]
MTATSPANPLELVLASGNAGKRREIEAICAPLGIVVRTAAELGFTEDIPETGDTFEENARLKACAVAQALGRPALADDSGLVVAALGGRPGVYSARYAGRSHDDLANNRKLRQEMAEVPDGSRQAAFVCVMCCCRRGGLVLQARGTLEGVIAREPAGENGFGYDPLFFLPERGLTVAQLPAGEKNQISHRARALAALAPQLADFLQRD